MPSFFSGPVRASKPGRDHDDVERILLAAGANAIRRDFLDSAVGARIHQQHILLVESLKVIGVQRLALGAIGIALRRQLVRDHGVIHRRADLAPEIVGDGVVGFLGKEYVRSPEVARKKRRIPRCWLCLFELPTRW
jgi:hypothetical protein